jgi:hypothetical protein
VTAPEALEALAARCEGHAKMCADFESMGTGEFCRHYPDYRLSATGGYGPEGAHYITRASADLAEFARAALARSTQA